MENSPTLKANARELRKNMTKEERHLWYDFLKDIKPSFHRQYMIAGYIVDFFNPKARIVIELDGSQHYSLDAMEADRKRDACMKANGLKVLRYSNADVNKNFEGVCMDILNNMRSD